MGPAVKMALASGLLAYGMGDFEDRRAEPGFKSSEKPGSQAEASPQQGPPLAAGAQCKNSKKGITQAINWLA